MESSNQIEFSEAWVLDNPDLYTTQLHRWHQSIRENLGSDLVLSKNTNDGKIIFRAEKKNS